MPRPAPPAANGEPGRAVSSVPIEIHVFGALVQSLSVVGEATAGPAIATASSATGIDMRERKRIDAPYIRMNKNSRTTRTPTHCSPTDRAAWTNDPRGDGSQDVSGAPASGAPPRGCGQAASGSELGPLGLACPRIAPLGDSVRMPVAKSPVRFGVFDVRMPVAKSPVARGLVAARMPVAKSPRKEGSWRRVRCPRA